MTERIPYSEVIAEVKRLVARGITPLYYLNNFMFDNQGAIVRKVRFY